MPPPPTAEVLPEEVDRVAMARLYGEPLFSLPRDLYIPPDALEVFLRGLRARWTCCST
jgi:segregation and condensation protein A